MNQDQPTANGNPNPDVQVSVEDVCRIAISHSLLKNADVNEILVALQKNASNPTPQLFARKAIQLGKLTLFQAKLLLAKDSATLSLGPYLLLDKIGQGGMGSVYKARHKSMDRVVALKVLRRKGGLSLDSVKRFQREVMAAAKLIHPNIVTAFDAGDQNGIHYLVMEYVEGGDLKSLIDQTGPLSVNQALQFTMQAARGLQYAHQQQIIHRDIKPANLLIDKSGCIKILDLGLARIIREQSTEEDHSLTSDGALMGTVDFLSPEQSLDTKSADVRSDIYSLGCTLFTLLSGEPVFPAGTMVQKILAHRETSPPSIKARRADVPDSVENLLQKMLAKRPVDRPQSMAAIADSLQLILASNPNSDLAPKLSPATTSDDAFLETLIMGGEETVGDNTPRPLVQTSSESLLPRVVTQKNTPQVSKRTTGSKKKSKVALAALILALLIAGVGGAFGLGFLNSRPKSLNIAFNPAQFSDISGASILIDDQTHGLLSDSRENPFRLSVDEGRHTLKIEKKGYEPFLYSFDTAREETLSVAVALRKQVPQMTTPPRSNQFSEALGQREKKSQSTNDTSSEAMKESPQPLDQPSSIIESIAAKNAPPPPSPKVETPPKSDLSNPSDSKDISTRTLVVGLGTGELPDLYTALQQAQPNDTILIRHRGPLEIPPIDLTGKTPLTIRGDSLNGTDYWPIIRQAKSNSNDSSADTPTESWIFGEKLDIKFINLHLGVGGHTRLPLHSVIGCKQGSIELENCTFTAAPDETTRLPAGQPFPFLRSKGADTHVVRINFLNTIIRGGRLENLARIDAEANLFVKCNNLLWAGGDSDLIQVGHTTSSAVFESAKSLFYNVKSLCGIPPDRLTGRQSKMACEFDLERTIISFSADGDGSIVRFVEQEDNRLNCDEWAKYIRFRVDDVLMDQLDYPLPVRDKKSNMKDFLDAFSLPTGELFILDPGFRVRPSRRELHEIDVRDFFIDVDNARNRKLLKGLVIDELGIKHATMPHLLSCLMEDGRKTPSLASTPRGKPRILKVDSEKGPYKTLEAAIKDLNDDDIIEIQDDSVYIPSRNYDLNSGFAVINIENIPHIELRAALGKRPTIVLSDSPKYQQGKILQQPLTDGSLPALLMLYASCRSMKLDGINFLTDINRANSKHYFVHTSASCMRISNCSFMNFANSRHPTMENTFGGMIVIRPLTWEASNDRRDLHGGLLWIENSVFNNGPPKTQEQSSNAVEAPNAIGYTGRADLESESFTFRNSFFGPSVVVLHSVSGTPNQWISVENCTIMGKPFLLERERTVRSIDFRDNFVLTSTNPIPCTPISLLDSLNAKGAGNAVWMQDSVILPQFRETGALRLMPGPTLKKRPEFVYQPPKSIKDVGKIFSVRPNQESASLASDKGPAGFRPEKTKL